MAAPHADRRRAGPGAVLALVVALTAGPLCPRTARAATVDAPTTDELVITGLGIAVPVYFLGVTMHEGTHALWALAFGGQVTELDVTPAVVNGQFFFGYTRYRGDFTRGQKAFILVAPKVTDLLILGGYAALVATDSLPSNKYGQLILTVLATGNWVDFTKDLFHDLPGSDLTKFHRLYGRTTFWQRLPYKLLQGALSGAAAYFLARGYVQVFRRDQPAAAASTPVIVQLFTASF